MRTLVVALALACGAAPACAATSSGYSALAVAALVGGYSPVLGTPEKTVLRSTFDGNAFAGAATIHVKADSVVCRAGDVDISAFGCDLKFGAQAVHLSGRQANELFASLTDMGVATDGAAGTIYVSVSKLRCVVDPAKVSHRDGSGADCVYAVRQSP